MIYSRKANRSHNHITTRLPSHLLQLVSSSAAPVLSYEYEIWLADADAISYEEDSFRANEAV